MNIDTVGLIMIIICLFLMFFLAMAIYLTTMEYDEIRRNRISQRDIQVEMLKMSVEKQKFDRTLLEEEAEAYWRTKEGKRIYKEVTKGKK